MAARPMRRVPIHYLRSNHVSWTPPAVFSFDTETASVFSGDDEVMTMRVWCAKFTDRRRQGRIEPEECQSDGTFGEDLAIWVDALASRRRTVWGYAHNLGFDLCTSDLVREMLTLGWSVTEFAVNSGSPFVRMRKASSVLTLSDSWSWFQCELGTVADAVGIPKPPLPHEDDSAATWLERCSADTEILHTAILTLMEWWDDKQLGKWNITGSASGWNAMRHIPSGERITIRPDQAECNYDRRAIYGGKRYAWHTGHSAAGHYTEIDIEKAYTNAVLFHPIPVGRQFAFNHIPNDHKWLDGERWGVIANATISTDTPLYPARIHGRVWYPVGLFRTTLAGPELGCARATGQLVSIESGWLHQLGWPLRPWAAWCLESMADQSGATPEVARLVHRMWARSAIGKWGQRGYEVVPLGPSPNSGWNHEEAWHHDANVPAGIVDFAGERYQVAAVNQSDNAYPAILAYVESYVRIALNKAAQITGDDRMVLCDTDGYLCADADDALIGTINAAIAPFRVRQKRHFRSIEVIGPQHMRLDGKPRTSGIPASAELHPDGRLHARTWPKLAWQLANGRPGAYVRPDQAYTMASTYAPGWVLSDLSVRPIEVTVGPDGDNLIIPWHRTSYAASGLGLGPYQNRHLEAHIDA